MTKFEESNFYKSLQDFFINADKKTFLQFLAEFYNRTEGIINKDNIQDDLIKELRELYLEFNEKGIDENIVREKVNYFLENSLKINDIISKLNTNANKIEDVNTKLKANTNNIENITSQLDTIDHEKVNESFVAKKIAEAKLEGAGVDTTSLVFRNDLDEELMKAEKRLDLKYVRGNIYGNGTFGDDVKYFRTKDPITFSKDTISKIYIKDGFQIIIWRWSDLSQNALAAQTFTSNTDFTFQANLYYHFVLKRINTSETMLDEEISNIKIITYPNYYFKVGLNEANNKIKEILNRLDNLDTSYATKYTDKEDSIVNNVYKSLNSGTIVFGLITDNHCGIKNWESCYKHGKILNSLAERVGADFCINLGDVFTDVDDRAENLYRLNEYWKYNNHSFLPNLYCKGNHECFIRSDGNVALEDWQILAQTQRSNRYISKSSNELFYYFDVRQCRFIVLDSSSNTNCGFSDNQEQFLQNAFDSIGNKKAVIFTHIPLDASLMLQATPKNAGKIRNVLSTNKDKVIAVMHGHTHWDNNAKLDDIEQISFCCAMPGKQDTSNFVGLGSPLSYERSHGTYSEYCMDIVCVDVYANVVRTFRFGVGSNRIINCK